MDKMILTHEMVESGKSGAGGWTRRQMEILGVDWPLVHGWKSRIVGKVVEKSVFDEFLALRNTSNKMKRRQDAGLLLKSKHSILDQLEIGEMTSVCFDGKSFAVRRTS